MESKICHGPLHPPGGELILLSEYTLNRTGPRKGQPLARCKRCRSAGNPKTVPSPVFMPLIEILFDGRSVAQVSELVNLDRNLVRDLQKGKRKRINKKTFLNLKRAVSALPIEKTSIGPKSVKTKRNGLNKLSFEQRIWLKNLVSIAQKERYKKDKALLRHVV